jgi:hypothetical protein
LTIDALTIAYATIAVLALPHLLTVGRALLGDGGATIRNPRIVRQPIQPTPSVASPGVSDEAYAAALLVIRKRLEQQMHAELQRVISTGPVS